MGYLISACEILLIFFHSFPASLHCGQRKYSTGFLSSEMVETCFITQNSTVFFCFLKVHIHTLPCTHIIEVQSQPSLLPPSCPLTQQRPCLTSTQCWCCCAAFGALTPLLHTAHVSLDSPTHPLLPLSLILSHILAI